MPEPNGDKWEARSQQWGRERESFHRDMQNLLTAQVIQKAQIDDLVHAVEHQRQNLQAEIDARKGLDQRVDKFVSAIGDLISRIPPENLRGQRQAPTESS